MGITITVAHTVPDAAFARIVALTQLLQHSDVNFKNVPLEVCRSERTSVRVAVADTDDKMREKLLWLLVADAVADDPNSLWGSLVPDRQVGAS